MTNETNELIASKYDHTQAENKIWALWEKENIFKAEVDSKKQPLFYSLRNA